MVLSEKERLLSEENVPENQEDNAQILCERIKQKAKLKMSLFVWEGFIRRIQGVSFEGDCLTLSAESDFHKDWLHNHYQNFFEEHITAIASKPVSVLFVHLPKYHLESEVSVASEPEGLLEPEPTLIELPRRSVLRPVAPAPTRLNSRYTFDNYVPGPANQMAHAACQAVVEQPGSQYSPLFLFGSSGMGKTHLLHAIGHATLLRNPKARVVYMSTEEWVTEYIMAIREKNFDAFRAKYRRSVDLLLIDDIQFLARKTASQDAFFHTFNEIHQAHRQIVVTADKYPHQIEGLEERLRTRLAWGLVADLRMPDIETRMAILDRKAQVCGVTLEKDVLEYLSTHISSSVRELEGALLRLSAFSALTGEPVGLKDARAYLRPLLRRASERITVEKVIDLVAHYFDMKPDDLLGKSRQKQVSLARQIAMTLCRVHLEKSLPEIGRAFGGRDHSTVLSSIRKIKKNKESDVGLQTTWRRLEKALLNSEETL
jgi:chromosomal replication initiator protein